MNKLTHFFNRHDAAVALALVIMAITIGTGLGWENNKIVPVNPAPTAHYTLEPHNRLSILSNWDGPIYLNIADHGYETAGQANFFPLYPLAIHLVHVVISSILDSALVVSWLAFFIATLFYLKIMKQLYGNHGGLEAARGTILFVFFPTAVFLFATYTEALFACFALGSLYFALRQRYVLCAIMALLCTATHVTGLFVLVLIGLVLLESGTRLWRAALTTAAGALGFIFYLIYQQVRFHNIFAFIDAQKKHNWFDLNPTHFFSALASLNGLFIILLVIAAIYWWQKRKSFAIYSFLYACIIFVGGKDLGGVGRYSLMAFPLQFMLYEYFRNKKVAYPLVITLCAILWTFYTLRYIGGYTGG